MTGVVKTDYSPKKGKENKNISNHIPVLATARKNAKNEANSQMTPKKEKVDPSTTDESERSSNKNKSEKVDEHQNESKDGTKEEEENSSSSTSNRSVRPQTKILRRPTPNLKHPVIHVDSDDSCGDSSSSDKSKDDNPKRLKMGSDSNPDSSHKRKNFIMYNKYNVDKNTKNGLKERTSATLPPAIPNPCNSCSRSQAPERLHSHARKDARGLMHRRSPALDVKMTSPQKKSMDNAVKVKKDTKSSPSVERTREETRNANSSDTTLVGRTEDEEIPSVVQSDSEPQISLEDLLEPLKACYICRKEFKVSLLLLHESKCLETWKKSNNSLNPNLRQLPPRRPEENPPLVISPPAIAADAGDPAWSAVQSQLIPCPLCGRTFFPERLPVHRRVCKGKQSPRPLKRASSLREQSASSTDGEEAKQTPLYLPCYVCGRNYGSWVLPMHEQQCLKKWRKENDKLSDDDRQEEPSKNPDFVTDDDVASLIELGDNAWESHLQQLVPCPRCFRTFFPDRLEIHERSCKGAFGNRRPRSNKGI